MNDVNDVNEPLLGNNANNNENVSLIEKFTPHEVSGLVNYIVGSAFFVFLILINYYYGVVIKAQSITNVLNMLLYVYTAFIFQGLFKIVVVKINKRDNFVTKLIDLTIDTVLYICYYLFIVIAIILYNKAPKSYLIDYTLTYTALFTNCLSGFINILQFCISSLFMIVFFFHFIKVYSQDPDSFYVQYGISPTIIQNLPGFVAKTEGYCCICADAIKTGERVLKLRCKHDFHENCIKNWLLFKMCCPMCRATRIL